MKFLGKFRRLTGPDGSKKITRSALECEVTQKLRERGAAGDFSPVRWGLHYTGTFKVSVFAGPRKTSRASAISPVG